MPIEITVGPPVLTINQGSTFVVSEHSGNMRADSEHGLFASDTRFVSYWAVFANGMPWTLLTCSPVAYYAARVNLTNPAFPTEDGDVPEGALHLTIGRSISGGVHEDLDVTIRTAPRHWGSLALVALLMSAGALLYAANVDVSKTAPLTLAVSRHPISLGFQWASLVIGALFLRDNLSKSLEHPTAHGR